MNKPFIKMIRVFSNNDCVASVDDGNGFTTEFTAPNEAVKDLNMRQRYDYMEARAERYIACLEPQEQFMNSYANKVADDLPFTEQECIKASGVEIKEPSDDLPFPERK